MSLYYENLFKSLTLSLSAPVASESGVFWPERGDPKWPSNAAEECLPASVRRAQVVDASFFGWPTLPVALADTIVLEFPLAHTRFNLSYASKEL